MAVAEIKKSSDNRKARLEVLHQELEEIIGIPDTCTGCEQLAIVIKEFIEILQGK
jgi:hypothetical protein